MTRRISSMEVVTGDCVNTADKTQMLKGLGMHREEARLRLWKREDC